MANETTALQLRERLTGLIATLTTEPEKVERGITIHHIINYGTPLSVLARQAEKATVKRLLDIQITKLAASFNMNLNLKDYQIGQIVEDLIAEFPNETIEDFVYVFRQARLGAYGEVYRLDSAVVFGWFKSHLERKYEAVEAKLMAEKDKPYEYTSSKDPLPIDQAQPYIDQLLKNIGKVESKAIPPMSEAEIKRMGREKPPKSSYKRPSKEYVVLHKLEIQWMNECFDPESGEPNDRHLSFDEWLKSR